MRTTRHVALTQAGELLLVRARRVLAEADTVRSEIDDLTSITRGDRTLAAAASALRAELIRAARRAV